MVGTTYPRTSSTAEKLDAAARELVETANRSGGEDNITVVFFEIADESADVPEETAQMPAVDENGAVDDEDTLSGLEGIPTVDTMVVPSTEAQAVAEPPRRRSRWLSLLVVLVVVIVLLAGPPASTGAVPVTLRNRELLNLFVLGSSRASLRERVLARQASFPRRRCRTPVLLRLYVAAHVVARVRCPGRPVPAAAAGLLTAFGVTEIYRLNPGQRVSTGLWIVVGVAPSRQRYPAPPRFPPLESYSTLRSPRSGSWSCRRCR